MSSDQVSASQQEGAVAAQNCSTDCFDTIAELVDANRRLTEKLHEKSGTPSVDLLAGIGEFVRRGVATGTRLYMPEERRLAQTLLDYWVVVYERGGSEAADSTLLPFDEAHPPLLPDEACPYIGLRAFEGENRSFFFGRTALIKRLAGKLKDRANRALWILGESGSGKSSVVRAGLLPALSRDPETKDWLVMPVSIPGVSPVNALRAALGTAGQELASGACIAVITIDQFEEVFTLCSSRTERRAFYAALTELLSPARQHRLIVTMRSDFVAEFRKDADSKDMPPAAVLYDYLGQCQETVGPLSPEELHEAIEQPAASEKLTVVPDVVDRLVTELGGRRDSLPLLQFTMRRLWKERERRHITLDAYKKVGGGSNALAYCADQVFEALEREGKADETKRIMLRLAAALKDELEVTRSRVSRLEIYNLGVPVETVDDVLDRFVNAELLRKSPGKERSDDLFEVAHEALVRNWNKLSDWLNAVKHSRVILGELLQRAVSWDKEGRPSSQLLTKSDLFRAADFLRGPDYRALGRAQLLEEYVQISAAAERRGWRMRLVAATTAGMVITAALAVAFWYWAQASKERQDKEREAKRLDAVDEAFEQYPDVASAASESPSQALKDARTAYDQLSSTMQGRHLERFERYPMTALYSIFSPLAGRSRLEFNAAGASVSELPYLQWSQDSRRLLVVADEKAHIYNSAGVRLQTIPGVRKAFLGPADTEYPVLTWLKNGAVELWIRSSQTQIQAPGSNRALSTAAFSRAGSQIYIGWTDHTAGVWNGRGKTELWSLKTKGRDVKHVIFSRNALLIAADDGQEVMFWDCLARQREQCEVQTVGTSDPENPIVDVAFMGREEQLLIVRRQSTELCGWPDPSRRDQRPMSAQAGRNMAPMVCEISRQETNGSNTRVLTGGATQDNQSYLAVYERGALRLLYPKLQLLAEDALTQSMDASSVKVSPDGTLVARFLPGQTQGNLVRLDAWPSESSAGAERKSPGVVEKSITPVGKLVGLSWRPDSQLLATAARTETGTLVIQFWLRDGTARFDPDDHMAGALYGHGSTITSLRTCQIDSPERQGNGVFSLGLDGRPFFWNLAKGIADTRDPGQQKGANRASQALPAGIGQHLRMFAGDVIRESSDCRYAAIFSPPSSVKIWDRGPPQGTIASVDDESSAQQYRNGFFSTQRSGAGNQTRLILLPQIEQRAGALAQVAFVDMEEKFDDMEKRSDVKLRPITVDTKPRGTQLGYCRSPDGHHFVSYPVGQSLKPSAFRWQTFTQEGPPAVMAGSLEHAGLAPAGAEIEIVDCEVSAGGKYVVTAIQQGGPQKKRSLWYWNFDKHSGHLPKQIYDGDQLPIHCGSEPPTIWMSLRHDEKKDLPSSSNCFEDKEMMNLLLSCGGKEAALVRLPTGTPANRRLYRLSGHGGNIMDASLSPDGQWAATGSVDRTVRLWPLANACRYSQPASGPSESESESKPKPESEPKPETRRLFEIAVLRGDPWDVTRVEFSKDSKHLVSGSAGRTVRMWPTPDHLLDILKTLDLPRK